MIIALVTLIRGGDLLFFVLLIISLIGMTELYKVFGIEKKPPGTVGYIAAIVYYGLLYFEEQLPGDKMTWFMMLFMAFLICEMATLVYPADIRGILRIILCDSNAVLYLPDKAAGGRYLYGMACLCVLLGMRYLRILCGDADRKA